MEREMSERIKLMAYRTWEVIASDLLTVLEENGQEAIMPRDHVMEVVCDASYMLTHGGDKEAYAVWNKLPTYKQKLAAVKPAFPYSKYGW